MVLAPKIKNALTTWLCAFVVMLSFGETRAEDFFAASHLESGQIAAANQGSISDFYDASQYDASGCTVAPNSRAFGFDMVNNPGPLAAMRENPAANFAGGKYNAITLADDLVLHRAGDAGTPLGQWFTRSPASSSAQVRIDSAVKPQWFDEAGSLTGSSPLNTNFSIRIPRGTTIYEGPVGYQGGVYLGGQGTNQIFVPQPWNIKGVEVLGSSPLR